MHEFGIVHDIEEKVRELLAKHNASRPTKIVVKACEQDGISRETMQFAFQHVIDEAGWQGAKLELQIEPTHAVCQQCRHRFEYTVESPNCPQCRSASVRIEPSPGPTLMSVEME